MVRLSRGVHSATAILASMTRGDWKVVLPPDHLVVNQDELFTVLYSIFFNCLVYIWYPHCWVDMESGSMGL